LIFPVFERMDLECGGRLKTMRSMSIILYMVQFVLIWLYDGACDRWLEAESIQYSVLQFSVVRFLVVLSISIAIAWAIVELEKRPKMGFLKYLH
jgi:hypothetical protein